MKPIIYALIAIVIAAAMPSCSTTTETFDDKGRVTSRTKAPDPKTWTVVSNAVATFGAVAVSNWAQQMADQQRWEKGIK